METADDSICPETGMPPKDTHPGNECTSTSSTGKAVDDILFSYYEFLSAGTVHKLDSRDFKYLESQGCFRFPERRLLDVFIEAYRLNVHPYQPFFSWKEFHRTYHGLATASRIISIFVFQAMLFAASSVRLCKSTMQTYLRASTFPSQSCSAWAMRTTWQLVRLSIVVQRQVPSRGN